MFFFLCNKNLNSFLTRLQKLFKGGNYLWKYGICKKNDCIIITYFQLKEFIGTGYSNIDDPDGHRI